MKRQIGFRPVDPAATLVEGETRRPLLEPLTDSALASDAAAVEPSATPAAAPRARPSPARWFWWSLGLFVGGVAVVESVTFVQAMYGYEPALGIAFAALLAMVLASAAYWAAWEIRQIRRLGEVEELRTEAAGLLTGDSYDRARTWMAKVESATGAASERARLFARANDTVLDTHSDPDALLIFRRVVLEPLDAQAYRAVARAARQTALGVSVSPIASLDAALTIWRCTRMVRQVAEIYGLRPGMAASMTLLRRLLFGALQTAAVDVLGNAWVEVLGNRFGSVLSARLGEGVFAAVRVARLGILTIEYCRPMPFTEEDRPSLLKLRQQILDWRQ